MTRHVDDDDTPTPNQSNLPIGAVHDHLPFDMMYEMLGDRIGAGGFAIVRRARHRVSE